MFVCYVFFFVSRMRASLTTTRVLLFPSRLQISGDIFLWGSTYFFYMRERTLCVNLQHEAENNFTAQVQSLFLVAAVAAAAYAVRLRT